MHTARDWIVNAGELLDVGKNEEARSALHQAELLAGDDAGVYRALAIGYCTAELRQEAVTAEMAALAYEQQSALMLYNLGTSFLMTQRPALAEKWYRAALRLDPQLVIAHQNLASILEVAGETAQAQYHRDQAYKKQNLFIDQATQPKSRVLILCASATGNVPFDFLLPSGTTTRIKWVMDYASIDQIASLPDYDIVFNAIGDQDVTALSKEIVQRFIATCHKPILNLPQAVARTSREQMAAALQDIDHLAVPRTVRVPARKDMVQQILASGLSLPVLVRPAGSHGGVGLRLLEDAAALDSLALQNTDHYLNAYQDYRSADGFYRKYRVIFIDRQPFPYHLAISHHWLVHYVSADMLPYPWKREEEEGFLHAPDAVLGAKVMQTLHAIARRIDLDFCGIDFSILRDGRILLFEANATMLVHREEFHPELQFKNPYVQGILDAFDAMLQARMAQ